METAGGGETKFPHVPREDINCGFPGKFLHRIRGAAALSCVVFLNRHTELKCVAKDKMAFVPAILHSLAYSIHRSEAFWTKAARAYVLVG